MAVYNIGKVCITANGEYDSNTAYGPLCVVCCNGSSYISLQNVIGITPGITAGWQNYWTMLADKGEKGEKGDFPEVTIGTVTTGEPGSAASVEKRGTGGNITLDFTLPQGVPGAGNVDSVDGVTSDNDGDVALGAVRYGAVQALTEPQKAQARTNIGACTLLDMYPVGSTYTSTVSTSPAELFGGTWERMKDRFLLGAGDTYAIGSTGGEASHMLTIDEMPSHSHYVHGSTPGYAGITDSHFNVDGIAANNTNWGTMPESAGGSQPHNNMPPYVAVYMWKRVA